MTKVIHVQLMQGRKNYYFGSIPAIYSVLTAEEIGIKQCSLERVGLSKGGVVLNKKHVSGLANLYALRQQNKDAFEQLKC